MEANISTVVDEGNVSIEESYTTLARKAWTAYVPISLGTLFLLLVVVPISFTASWKFGLIVLILVVAYSLYKVLLLRSHHLFYDDSGVWFYSGVFPWNSGTRGVKWRDLDEALMIQSFGSWLFKSYSICIRHRYTKDSEISLSHMAKGDRAVVTINQFHQALARNNALH